MSSLAEPLFGLNSQQLADKFSIPLSRYLSLEVYSSTKPHNLKIANLQKGLILTCNGVERVGEGAGFGVPVLVCPDETFFSGSSSVRVAAVSGLTRMVKEFHMDRVARNALGNVRLENREVRALMKYLAVLYQKNKGFRSLLFRRFLTEFGIEVVFERVLTRGRISVTYTFHDNVVDVKVDLSQVGKRYRRGVFVLNEQSASFFRKYSDSRGTRLVDGEVGAWDNVDAEWACFSDLREEFGFRLWRRRDAVLRRGRETMRGCLDWVGLDYELNPDVDVFEYKIEQLGAKSNW